MRLVDAYNLLIEDGVSDSPRYFAEVYKSFQFTDDDSLADYIDFIVHEPVHWMRGFPAKLTTKTSFSKPKTAVIKLLKKPAVQNELGVDVVETAHGAIWSTFKKEHETLLKERSGSNNSFRTVVEHMDHRNEALGLQTTPFNTRNNTVEETNEAESDVGEFELLEDIEPVPPVLCVNTPPWKSETSKETNTPPSLSVIEETANTFSPTTIDPKTHSDDKTRIEILKSVLLAMSETLPAGTAKAFRLLVDSV